MAPEHLDAFNPLTDTAPEVVDARSDVYSLGMVFFLFLTGQAPFTKARFDQQRPGPSLHELAAERRAGAPSLRAIRPEVPELLDRLIRRCLEPAPAQRFQSAEELLRALEGCQELHQVEKEPASPFFQSGWWSAHPFAMIFVLALIPHVLGSLVNIAYNELQIVATLTAEQKSRFFLLVMVYNVFAYPLMVLTGIIVVRRVMVGREWLRRRADLPAPTAERIRRQALALPGWCVALSALGWFPGGVLFPLGLDADADVSRHFLFSFLLSGLIALTYSYFGVQFVVLRLLYPQLWSDPANARQHARRELAHAAWFLLVFQILAGLIPLAGAGLLIVVAPDQLTFSFRVLAVGLIALGVAGFGLATMVRNRLDRVLMRLTGHA